MTLDRTPVAAFALSRGLTSHSKGRLVGNRSTVVSLGLHSQIRAKIRAPFCPNRYVSDVILVTAHRPAEKEDGVNNNTSRISWMAIIAALAAAAVVSSVWYSPFLFGKEWMELSRISSAASGNTAIPGWKMLIDLVREFVVIYVLARLINGLRIIDWKGAVKLGFWVWLGFPVQMLMGASLWDNKPWMLDLIHGGDWLMKMLVIALILAKWPRVQMAHLQTSS